MEKKIFRSRKDKMISGVCGGIAEYFSVDASIVRIIVAALALSGTGIVAYIIAVLIIPEKKDDAFQSSFQNDSGEWEKTSTTNSDFEKPSRDRNRFLIGAALIFFGVVFLLKQVFDWFNFSLFWPLVLVGVGLLVITRGRRG